MNGWMRSTLICNNAPLVGTTYGAHKCLVVQNIMQIGSGCPRGEKKVVGFSYCGVGIGCLKGGFQNKEGAREYVREESACA